jgi:hypothetical protein
MKLSINGKRTNIRLKDFYVLVDLLNVDRNSFEQAAADILWKYTDRLPMYFEKLASMFSDFIAYEMSLAEAMVKIHQNRIKQLEKNGWYEQLRILYCK